MDSGKEGLGSEEEDKWETKVLKGSFSVALRSWVSAPEFAVDKQSETAAFKLKDYYF